MNWSPADTSWKMQLNINHIGQNVCQQPACSSSDAQVSSLSKEHDWCESLCHGGIQPPSVSGLFSTRFNVPAIHFWVVTHRFCTIAQPVPAQSNYLLKVSASIFKLPFLSFFLSFWATSHLSVRVHVECQGSPAGVWCKCWDSRKFPYELYELSFWLHVWTVAVSEWSYPAAHSECDSF